MLWDEATIEVLVRGTARLSVTLFLVWLLRQGWLRWRGGLDTRAARRQRNLFVVFAGAHVVHLAFVLLLAQVTQGESIRARGGWLLVTLTGGVIYLAIVVMALAHLGWIPGAARIRASRGAEIAATTLVWVAFMQAYTGRVLIFGLVRAGSDPAYDWNSGVPVAALTFFSARAANAGAGPLSGKATRV